MCSVKTKRSFTLIELLLVVLIISIISGISLSVINVGSIRSKTSDSQRKADLRKITTALELYFSANRLYPVRATWGDTESVLSSILESTYINDMPQDPKYGSTGSACPVTSSYRYNYITDASGYKYVLLAGLEQPTSDASLCESLSNCSSITCGCGNSTYCYAVQNPL